HVAPVQAVDKAAHGAQQLGCFLAGGIGDDHGFSTAQWQLRHGGFVGHAAGQAQHVGEGLFIAGIGMHSASAEGRTERGVVHGDDGAQSALLVEAKQHLLVLVVMRVVEKIHVAASFVSTQATRSTMRTTCESSCCNVSSFAASALRYCSAAFSRMW